MEKKITKNMLLHIPLLLFFILYNMPILHATAKQYPQSINIVTIDYPPLLGGPGTIMTDITTSAFQVMGITVNYNIYPMARVVRSITTNSVSAALGSRNWFYKSSDPNSEYFVSLYWLNMHFFYLKDKFPEGLFYETLSDLQNYKIGYIRGGALIPIFEQANITPELVATLKQNVKKVHAGRDDMFAATELGGWAIINKYYANEIYNFAASKKPIYHISADIIFADDQQYLSEIFKEGLDIIKKNGTYLSIVENYYGSRGVPEQILKFIENP